jgi:replicative DNA helicase
LTPASANVAHYIKLVHDAWVKRLVHEAALRLYTNVETMSAEEAVAALEESALNIATTTENKHDVFIDLKRALKEVEDRFDHPLPEGWGIPAPFTFLEPLQGGRLYVLAAYSGDGKTVLGTQFASTAAMVGRKVGICSVEMSYSDLTNRWLQQRTGINQGAFRTGRVPIDRIDTARDEMQQMSGWDVKIIDDEAMTTQAIRKYQRLGKFDLLIIDHLHRMRWKDRHDLEDNIRAITNVAREFEVPVLLLCQLARAGDHAKPFPVPSLRQLRETAMLEAEASSVWFVYRERDDNHLQTNDSKFIVAKNRYGKVGSEPLWFDEVSTAFTEDDWRQ